MNKNLFLLIFKNLLFSGLALITITFFVLYFVYIDRDKKRIKNEINETVKILQSMNFHDNDILNILKKNYKFITNKEEDKDFEYKYNDIIHFYYSKNSRKDTKKEILIRMGFVSFFWIIFLIFISIKLSSFFKPFEDITKLLSTFNINKPKKLFYKKYKILAEDFLMVEKKFNQIINQMIKQQEINDKLINCDQLTKIPNRNKLEEDFKKLSENNTDFNLIFIDLDDFKNINDTLGHNHGDIVLKEISFMLFMELSLQTYRLGGDEFIVINEDILNASTIISLILKSIEKYKYNDIFNVTASVGVSSFKKGKSLNDLLKEADLSMYNSKINKNSACFFEKKFEKILSDKVDLNNELKMAVYKREFVTFFQPQFNYLTKKIVGAEALIRWKHQTKGLLTPYFFIEELECSDLIIEASKIIIEDTFKYISEINNSKNDIYLEKISINLVEKQISSTGFYEFIMYNIKKYNCNPKWIEFEITERSFVNLKTTNKFIQKMKKEGFCFSIDDFGTGYSSLSIIQDIDIEKIKIDKIFVDNLDNGIIDIIIELSNKINTQTIIEGVETEEQLNYLISKGCYVIQGYLFSKPIEKNKLTELLRKYNHGKYLSAA